MRRWILDLFLISLILLIMAMVSGCSSVVVKPDDVSKLRTPPAEAMALCEGLTPLQDPSMGALVNKVIEASTLLKDCSGKQKELADWIKRGDAKK